MCFNLEMDGFRRGKSSKTRHMMSTRRNHSQKHRFWHTIATEIGDRWTAQYVSAATILSGVKGERRISPDISGGWM